MDISDFGVTSFYLENSRATTELPKELVYYVATPYSNFPGGPGAAMRIAVWASAGLLRGGYTCVSPIAAWHSAHQSMPIGNGRWSDFEAHNLRLVRRLDALIFVMLRDASLYSVGMKAEFHAFADSGKPVYVWEPYAALLTQVGASWDPWEEANIIPG